MMLMIISLSKARMDVLTGLANKFVDSTVALTVKALFERT